MNYSDLSRNAYMVHGSLAKRGYMRWWHSFCAVCHDTFERRIFFIEYFIINPSLGDDFPITGQFSERHIKPSYVMIRAGVFGNGEDSQPKHFQAFYPSALLKSAYPPMVMQVGHNFYSENHIYGSVEVTKEESERVLCEEGSLEWDLEVCKYMACQTGPVGDPLSWKAKRMESCWHAEGMRTAYRGSVILDGQLYEVIPERSYGYADKHWGRSYQEQWLQFASSCLTSTRTGKELKRSAIALNVCNPHFPPLPQKQKMILQLTYEGEDFEYNFSRPETGSHCKWKVRQTSKRIVWQIVAKTENAVIKVTGNCLRQDMLLLPYEAPDGSVAAKPMWGGNGTGTVLLYQRTPQGKELMDTISVANALCVYQE